MSMITELIEKLKNYAQILEDTSTNNGSADLMCIKTMREAADVIYELSSKLHAINMERSSQYYHDGWVPMDERTPSEHQECLVMDADGDMAVGYWRKDAKAFDSPNFGWLERKHLVDNHEGFSEPCGIGKVVKWRPLPEGYRGER